VLYLTLFGRQIYQGDPLGIIFGGWDFRLYEEGGDIHAFYNLFMLTPVTFLMFAAFTGRKMNFLRTMLIAVFISFGMSLVIEISQALFCVGTLQISDLVYNTISGLFGAMLYKVCLIRKNTIMNENNHWIFHKSML
jgi:glycopeptide antibiotics resistance protein